MLHIRVSKQYKKSLKKILRSGKTNFIEIDKVIKMLAMSESLPAKYRDHFLKGEWMGYRECHIQSDLLLIYSIEEEFYILDLMNIGSHSSLFE